MQDPKINFVLSSLCTKWMQLNAKLEKIDCINITETDTTNGTANKLILYSILDEFKLNESQKPQSPNINVDRKTGYSGLGFISHIANETQGTVYILDVMSMPDPFILYGSTLKPLTHVPLPGEMFAYIYQEKYLFRAIRSAYEYRDQNSSTTTTNQFGAMLIDIGCVVRVDIKPNYRDLYEVTQAAKIIPAYAKMCHLVQIPPKMSVYDLLHTRIQYKVLCNDGNHMFVNIVNAGVNPFAVQQQKEWNFYMYFFGHHLNTVTTSKITSDQYHNTNNNIQYTVDIQHTKPETTVPVERNENDLNPFADSSQYEIKSIAITPLNDKRNPFYYDPNNEEIVSSKPKFLNFQLTKILNNLSDDWIDKNLQNFTASTVSTIGTSEKIEEKITNQSVTNVTNERVNAIEKVAKTPAQMNDLEKAPQVQQVNAKQPAQTLTRSNLVLQPPKVPEPQLAVENQYNKQSNHRRENIQVEKFKVINDYNHSKSTNDEPKEKMQPTKKVHDSDSSKEKSTSTPADYPQPKNLPAIGDQIVIMYEHMVSVEEFYAVIWNDPTRDMKVDQFSALMNKEEHKNRLSQYNHKCKPNLFDKVIAMCENYYCRAKIIKVIDEHVFQVYLKSKLSYNFVSKFSIFFQVYFVDYGNCAKMQTLQLYKYDEKWDKYPVYALHFRLNGVEEVNPWDHRAREAIEQIMITECEATIVDIIHCEKLNRNTYVVDLRDENGLDVAKTLINKNYALPIKHLANHAARQRSNQRSA